MPRGDTLREARSRPRATRVERHCHVGRDRCRDPTSRRRAPESTRCPRAPSLANSVGRWAIGILECGCHAAVPTSISRAGALETGVLLDGFLAGTGAEMKRDPAIDAYLATVSPRSRALLEGLRKTIRALVPAAEECISYRLPAFRLEGRIIGGFSATAKGCSYYPFSGTTLTTLAEDLEGYTRTRGALHFDAERPLPKALVRKLLSARMAEGRRGVERRTK